MVDQYECKFKLMCPHGKLRDFSGKLWAHELRMVTDIRRFGGCHVLQMDVKPIAREKPDMQRLGVSICLVSVISTLSLIVWMIFR